jgi:hypothetical protein
MFHSNLTWQDEKTMLQEETMGFIIETIQNLTLLLNQTSNADSLASVVQKSIDVSCNASLTESDCQSSADFNPVEV